MSKRRALAITIVVGALVLANVYSPYKVDRVAVELKPEVLTRSGPWLLTNTIVGGWVAIVICILLALAARRHLVDRPSALSAQNIVESLFDALLGFMQRFVGEHAMTFFPLVCTFFLYILISNWLGLVPGFGSIGFWHEAAGQRVWVPLLRSATTDLNTTAALAVWSVLSSQYFGVRALGFVPYTSRFVAIGRFVEFIRALFGQRRLRLGLIPRGVLDLFIGILEIFEEITKILSFSFRLFGNVFGGEVLLAVMAFLMPYVASLPFMAIELFTGFIQAFIFAVLSTAFFGRAIASGHREPPQESQAPVAATVA